LLGEQAARDEGGIADDFGVEAETILLREEFVFGVDGSSVRAREGGLLIRGAGYDEFVKRFLAPAAFDERGGEIVE
jgi:hypothetical protein